MVSARIKPVCQRGRVRELLLFFLKKFFYVVIKTFL
jgi:hypothetical protein